MNKYLYTIATLLIYFCLVSLLRIFQSAAFRSFGGGYDGGINNFKRVMFEGYGNPLIDWWPLLIVSGLIVYGLSRLSWKIQLLSYLLFIGITFLYIFVS